MGVKEVNASSEIMGDLTRQYKATEMDLNMRQAELDYRLEANTREIERLEIEKEQISEEMKKHSKLQDDEISKLKEQL